MSQLEGDGRWMCFVLNCVLSSTQISLAKRPKREINNDNAEMIRIYSISGKIKTLAPSKELSYKNIE